MNRQSLRNSTIGWAAICMMSLSLFGQAEPPEDGTDIPKPVRVMVRCLDMSPPQVERFVELRQLLRECVAPRHQALKELKAKLKEALSQGAPSVEIGDLVIEIHALKHEIRRCHAAYQRAFGDMLDGEQLAKMERLQAAARLRPVIHASRRWDCCTRLPTHQDRMRSTMVEASSGQTQLSSEPGSQRSWGIRATSPVPPRVLCAFRIRCSRNELLWCESKEVLRARRYNMECFHTPRYQPNHIGTENNSQGSSLPIVNPNEGQEYPSSTL